MLGERQPARGAVRVLEQRVDLRREERSRASSSSSLMPFRAVAPGRLRRRARAASPAACPPGRARAIVRHASAPAISATPTRPAAISSREVVHERLRRVAADRRVDRAGGAAAEALGEEPGRVAVVVAERRSRRRRCRSPRAARRPARASSIARRVAVLHEGERVAARGGILGTVGDLPAADEHGHGADTPGMGSPRVVRLLESRTRHNAC